MNISRIINSAILQFNSATMRYETYYNLTAFSIHFELFS